MIQRLCRKKLSTGSAVHRRAAQRFSLLLALMVIGAAATSETQAHDGANPAETQVVRIEQLREYTIQEFVLPAVAGGDLELPISLENATHLMRLHPHSVRSPEFSVRIQNGDGTFAVAAAPPAATMRGWVEGLRGSSVSATVRQGRLAATILDDAGEQWHIQPLSEVTAGVAAGSSHIIYRASDVLWSRGHCEEHGEPAPMNHFRASTYFPGGAAFSGGMKVCDIAFDADVEFFQINGHSVANTVADIENIMNHVSLIYETQANVRYEITTIIIRTAEPDPYSSTNNLTLLTQFSNEWNTNMQGVHRDIAHLMTGKEIANDVIGTAYNGTMCQVCGNALGYGFSQSHFEPFLVNRVCLTAHELGHNWGATHCDANPQCSIMCSTNGDCSGNCSSFEAGSLSVILNGVNSASCLSTMADPVIPPFCDRFDSVISSSNWAYNAAASLSGGAANPPSPPNALALNTCCTPCAAAPDDIRSNYILLGGAAQATFSYYTQHAGGAGTNGAQFVVDYFNSAGTWVELNRITSNGVAQSTFQRWSHSLPPDALHNEFRMRFRVATATNQPTWYVDDVSVLLVEASDPILYVRQSAPAGGSGTSWSSAYADLQDALDVARCSSGVINQIWVAAGSYRPDRGTNDRAATFQLLNGVEILGGFSGYETMASQRDPTRFETILTGHIGLPSATDNSYHVVTAGGTGRTAVLDGFTISDGYAGSASPNNAGAGIYNISGSPTIRNCKIINNRASSAGGMFNSTGASPLIQGCTFRGNESMTISGAAMGNTLGSTPIIERCRFHGNIANFHGGAIHASTSSVTISDSEFVGNVAHSGGAVYNASSSAILTNCTIAQNVAIFTTGGIFNSGSSTALLNSILWGNSDQTGTGEAAQISGAAFADYSCIQDANANDATVFPGIDNIDDPPLFIRNPYHGGDGWGVGNNDDFGDLRLTANSPCVNTGDPSFVFTVDDRDLEGHARVLCTVIDRGAYERGIGDIDCDHDIDATDFMDWSLCFTGPTGGPYPIGCEAFDFDFDGDVDLPDQAAFTNAFLAP